MQLTVATKIAAGFALALIVLVILGTTSYQSIKKLLDAADWQRHTQQVLLDIREFLSQMKDAETGQRGYLITGQDRYLDPYRSGTSSVNQTLKELRQLTKDNPRQQARLDAIEPLVASKFAELQETIELRKEKGFDDALKVVMTDKGKQVMDDIRKQTNAMEAEENDLLKKRTDEWRSSSSMTQASILYGIPIAVLVVSVIGFVITRNISRPLTEISSALAAAGSEMVASVAELTANAQQTATAVSETTTTVEEVRQTAQLSSEKAKYVADTAQKTAQTSQDGRKATDETIGGMNRIKQQMESIAESMVKLSEQTQAIGDIIASVDDLAQQSNLLAVNASIEAAKAGDQGKGFGVVANEVKSLAEQSRQATTRVRSILSDIQKATGAAVMATEQGSKSVESGLLQSTQAGESIVTLASNVAEAAQAATQISASSGQQLAGVDQVATAMESIKQASSQNVQSARQLETAARNLSDLGQKLKQMVQRYKV
jgi:methyl-accepting chemotaxis protein